MRKPSLDLGGSTPSPAGAEQQNGTSTDSSTADVMSSLAGLDLSSSATTTSPTQMSPSSELPGRFDSPSTKAAASNYASNPTVDKWFEKLTYAHEGILFEDVQIQIGVKTEYHGHLGRVALYFGNKMPQALTSFTASVDGFDTSALSVSFAKIPQTTIPRTTQTQQILHVECKSIYSTPPILQISFMAGSLQTHRLRLPIVITKFFEPVKFGQAEFFERWKLIGGPPREAQVVFPINLDTSGFVDTPKQKKVVAGNGFQLLEGVDPNPINLVGAGVLHTSGAGKVGCLLRVEPNREAKLCRLTLRSTSEIVAAEGMRLIQKPLSLE